MTFVVQALIAVLGIGGSLLINWWTHLRGASIRMVILNSPHEWTLARQHIQRMTGVRSVGSIESTDCLQLTTDLRVLVGNSGPRNGVVVDLRVIVNGLEGQWETSGSVGNVDWWSVPAWDEKVRPCSVVMRCPINRAPAGLHLLRTAPPDLSVHVSYHQGSRRRVITTKAVVLPGLEVRRRIALAGRAWAPSLDRWELTDQLTAELHEALGGVTLSDGELGSCMGIVGWVVDNPASRVGVAYRIDGEDGSATLFIETGSHELQMQIPVDSQRVTLYQVQEAHRKVVTRALALVNAADSWWSLGHVAADDVPVTVGGAVS